MGRNARPRLTLLGGKLRVIRERKGATQLDMYRIIRPYDKNENNQSIISLYERGLREPNLTEIVRYAKFARISTDMLLDDDLNLSDFVIKVFKL